MSNRELGIYLNDHLAGAAGGVDLAHRAASNSTEPERTAMWETIGAEVAADRKTLIQIRDLVGVKPNRIKYTFARVGEKLGRLKLNGRLVRSSDLGQMLELEFLVLGVTGKMALWRALERLEDSRLSEVDFELLIKRAEAQRSRLEQFRINLVPAALNSVKHQD